MLLRCDFEGFSFFETPLLSHRGDDVVEIGDRHTCDFERFLFSGGKVTLVFKGDFLCVFGQRLDVVGDRRGFFDCGAGGGFRLDFTALLSRERILGCEGDVCIVSAVSRSIIRSVVELRAFSGGCIDKELC